MIDNSKLDITNITPLLEGEAADICGTGDVPTDPVRLDNGIMVATYWSNADNACVPFPTADLEVAKTDSPDPVNAGEQLFYTLTVTNHGPNDVPDVSVKDTLPSQVEFVTDDRGICTEGPTGTLTCNFGKVLNGRRRPSSSRPRRGERGLECRPPDRDHQLRASGEHEGADPNPRTTGERLGRSSRIAPTPR